MPKAAPSSFPVSALFGVVKPSGPTSMSVIHTIQELVTRSRLFTEEEKLKKMQSKKVNPRRQGKIKDAVKVGQGGTLDPLADGVLVIGIGKGTKKLSEFLNCTKEYQTTCLLGCETDTYDSEGKTVRHAPWKHVTREQVEKALPAFTGTISQTPPIFSALKMDGRPLYEYARQGIPLPRPIESRQVTVHSLEIVKWLGNDHTFSWPAKSMTDDEKKALETALKGVEKDTTITDDEEDASEGFRPTAFVLKMTVSGGTYVRSIVHDLAQSVGSSGHVVTLSRTRQGRFAQAPTEEADVGCVPWEVFEAASKSVGDADDEGWTAWEREVMERLEIV